MTSLVEQSKANDPKIISDHNFSQLDMQDTFTIVPQSPYHNKMTSDIKSIKGRKETLPPPQKKIDK